MGKLRNILTHFIKYKPDSNLPQPICTHKHLPERQQHSKLIANSLDICISHGQKMCNVCSEVHVQQHCIVDMKVNKDLGSGLLKDFNVGHMMMLPLSGLKCICGKPLGHQSNHAICAACGLASCSEHCHSEWEKKGNCTYHQNFYQKPEKISMRSILFQNIKNIQSAKINEWNLACKSSLSYIGCYAKANANYVLLQRGYRNYGIPQPDLVQKMKKMKQGLDFTTHIQRVCECKCQACVARGFHSVGNCEFDCHYQSDFTANSFVDNTQMYYQCECDCEFCRSGTVVTRHTKYDCAPHCYKSHYNIDKLS